MNSMLPISIQQYLNFPEVRNFIDWLETKLDPPGVFKHSYHLVKANKNWECNCLYEAYENYWWPYSQYCLVQRKTLSGYSFKESFAYMSDLAKLFRDAVSANDAKLTSSCALEMLKWGGVLNFNRERILEMGNNSPAYFKRIREHLDLNRVTLNSREHIFINSGFTKLYFLLVDNFIMYDGRVGAALGLLGRMYAEENSLAEVPPLIEFSFGSGKTSGDNQALPNRRDPSNERYRLPEYTGNPERHLKDNIKASWILKSLADQTESRFKHLPISPPLNERLTALQSALFMVGYSVSCPGNNGKSIQPRNVTAVSEMEKYPFVTVGRGYRFRVDYDRERDRLCFTYPLKSNGKRRAPDFFGVSEVVEICCYLERKFSGSPFPLANNVEKLNYNNENPGLGMAIRSLPGADVLKAQASSYLGPYLMNLGVFELVNSRPTTWKLVVDADAVGVILKQKVDDNTVFKN